MKSYWTLSSEIKKKNNTEKKDENATLNIKSYKRKKNQTVSR